MGVKKRGISAIVTLMLILSLSAVTATDTKAAEETKAKSSEELPMIDGSYLIKDEESVGTTSPMTRGEDLMTGYSKVRRLGAGEIYAGGTTIAAHAVDRKSDLKLNKRRIKIRISGNTDILIFVYSVVTEYDHTPKTIVLLPVSMRKQVDPGRMWLSVRNECPEDV